MRRSPIALSLLALAFAGCSVESSDKVDDEGTSAGQEAALTDPGACPATRFIGPVGGSCGYHKTPRGIYNGTKLAPDTTMSSIRNQCVYEWKPYVAGDLPNATDIAVIPTTFDRDCNVVGALASPVGSSPEVLGPLHDAFVRAAGNAVLPRKITGGYGAPVRVAVVDSTPTKIDPLGKALKGTFDHGFAVGRVIRELTCPPDDGTKPNCVAQVANVLALPMTAVDVRDTVNGGYFGSQADLAKAIVTAVDGWSNRRRAIGSTEPSRLVINLSVGWDSLAAYDRSSTHPGQAWGAATVLASLNHAACKGALVVAAAGNRSGSTIESAGAMYPARWEFFPAPTEIQCRELEGTGYVPSPGTFPPAGVYAPLVYAVGGVDATDRPLVLSRPTGMPRLVAVGAEAVASVDSAGFTDNRTGTSMSTAVVTAAATAVWSYAPGLSPAQVMELVRKGATDLSVGAPLDVKTNVDFCLKGEVCGTRKRVTVAGAVAALCRDYPSICETAGSSLAKTVAPAYAGQSAKFAVSWSSIDPSLASVKSATNCEGPNCASPSASFYGSTTKPWVGPQPNSGGCDICAVNSWGGLFLILQDNWWNAGPAYLGVTTTNNASYSYTLTDLKQANAYQLSGYSGTINSAQLSFSPQPSFATMEQVMFVK